MPAAAKPSFFDAACEIVQPAPFRVTDPAKLIGAAIAKIDADAIAAGWKARPITDFTADDPEQDEDEDEDAIDTSWAAMRKAYGTWSV